MKYKVLLKERGTKIADYFFSQEEKNLEVMTTSHYYKDIIRHVKYFGPDVFVYVVSGESEETVRHMAEIKEKLTASNIPLILVGSADDCDDFKKSSYCIPDLTLKEALTPEEIETELKEFMEGWKIIGKSPYMKSSASLNQVMASRKHILVVDDSPIMLKTLHEHLSKQYDVATAVSGKIAMKFLERRSTNLILLDYQMPEENGVVILEKLRKNPDTMDIPVIFLTGVADREKIKEALALNPQGYLLKPIDKEKLLETIAKVID